MLKRGFQFAPGYRLQEFLGRGQFGQVWRATAPGGTAAAIKFIDLTDGQGQKEYDGVKRVKQINHANLMPITAIWLLDGQGQVIEEAPDEAIQTIDLSVQEGKGQSGMFIPKQIEPSWLAVSMLLGGMSLSKRLRDCVDEGLPGIPPKELIRYMDESAKGLDYLNAPKHDLGEGPIAIQHCDVKPANIVLIGDSAVVCDFGLARILTRNQVTATSAAGTPAYMAPEAISGKPSRTSDQYSLAVTYYHLRTGTLPVNDGSLWEVLDAHRRGKLSLGLVPESEQEVLRKATDLDWEKRFESNIDLVDALREALRAEGHTRPSFIPSAAASQQNSAQENTGFAEPVAGTQAAVDDPTATYGTQMLPPAASPDKAFQRTSPVIESDEQTDADIPTDTVESLPADTPPRQPSSVGDVLKSKPKVLYAGVGGLVLLLAVGFIFTRDGDTEPPVEPPGNGGGSTVIPPGEVERTPTEIFEEALTKLEEDEESAIRLAVEAIQRDKTLAEMRSLNLVGHEKDVFTTIMTPDAKHLVTVAFDSTPLLWNLDQATLQSELHPVKLVGHKAEKMIEVAMSEPAGERFVTCGLDDLAFVWNLQASDVTLTRLPLGTHESAVIAVAWHPTEPIVVTATDKEIHVHKLGKATSTDSTGTVESKKFATEDRIRSLAIDPTGKWLIAFTDSIDEPSRAIAFHWSDVLEVFNVASAPSHFTTTVDGSEAECSSFIRGKPDESLLVTGDRGGSVSIWNITDDADNKLHDRVKNAHTGSVLALRVVQVGEDDVIVSGGMGGSVHVQTLGATSQGKTQAFGSAPVSAVDVSADGRWVVVGTKATRTSNGMVWLWDASAEIFHAVQLSYGAESVTTVRLSSDGKWIIVGRKDGTVQLWDQQKAKLLALSQPISPPSSDPSPMTEVETPKFSQL